MTQQPTNAVELDLVQDLIYELRVEQVMTREVMTIAPRASMSEARRMMRDHRLSGLPVVQPDMTVVGIVSIEDVINWLSAWGGVYKEVREKMSTPVISARGDERVAEVIKKFARHKYGRLPVLDEEGKLAGIVTPGDVTGRVLVVLSRRLRGDVSQHDSARLIDLLAADETLLTLRYNVLRGDFKKAGEASIAIKRALLGLGVERDLARRAAVCAYEAEMNLVIHSFGGLLVAEIRPKQVTILTLDEGPGIPDVAKAMEQGFSTAPDWIRELGFGAGMGLANIKHNSDQLEVISDSKGGTSLTAIIHLREAK